MEVNSIMIELDNSNNPVEVNFQVNKKEKIYQWIDSLKYGSLIIFPSKQKSNKIIVMCGGGGLLKINTQHEGYDFVEWFNKLDITFAILKYHLPADDRFATLNDALQSVAIIRKLYPSTSIGIMGASIGGYIAAHAAIYGTDENKVDFQILMYPVINMQNTYTHLLSRDRLFGKELTDAEQIENSLEYQIGQTTPSAFIVDAADDATVSPTNSIRYCEYLISNKIPVSFHLYPTGGHGFGFNKFDFKEIWLHELKIWLSTI